MLRLPTLVMPRVQAPRSANAFDERFKCLKELLPVLHTPSLQTELLLLRQNCDAAVGVATPALRSQAAALDEVFWGIRTTFT